MQLFTKNYILGLVVLFLCYMEFYMTSTTMVSHITGMGIDIKLAGMATGVVFIVMAVGRPLSGYMADRLDLRGVMLIAAGIFVITNIGMYFSTSIALILLLRALDGFAVCILTTTNSVAMLQDVKSEIMGKAVAYSGLISALCSAIGPQLGQTIMNSLGSRKIFLFTTCISILISVPIMLYGIPKYERTVKSTTWKDFIDTRVLPYGLLVSACAFGIGVVNSYFLATANVKGIRLGGLFFTVSSVVMIILKIITGNVIDRHSLKRVVVPAFIITMISLLLIPGIKGTTGLVICAVMFAFDQGSAQPSIQAQCYRMVPISERGIAVSTFYMCLAAGQALASIGGGIIADKLGYNAVYYAGALILLIALATFFILDKNKKDGEPPF